MKPHVFAIELQSSRVSCASCAANPIHVGPTPRPVIPQRDGTPVQPKTASNCGVPVHLRAFFHPTTTTVSMDNNQSQKLSQQRYPSLICTDLHLPLLLRPDTTTWAFLPRRRQVFTIHIQTITNNTGHRMIMGCGAMSIPLNNNASTVIITILRSHSIITINSSSNSVVPAARVPRWSHWTTSYRMLWLLWAIITNPLTSAILDNMVTWTGMGVHCSRGYPN